MSHLGKFLFGAGILFLVAGIAVTILPGGFSPSSSDNTSPDTPVAGQQEVANDRTATETSAPDTETAAEQASSTTGDSEKAYRPQTDQGQASEIRDDDESDVDGEEEKKGEQDKKGEEKKGEQDKKGEEKKGEQDKKGEEKKGEQDKKGEESKFRAGLLFSVWGLASN